MTSSQCTNRQGEFNSTSTDHSNYDSHYTNDVDEETEYANSEKLEGEFHLANETTEASLQSTHSGTSSCERLLPATPKRPHTGICRPKSAKVMTPKSQMRPNLSSIPLPVKGGPLKVPSMVKNVRSGSRTNSIPVPRQSTTANKHTLEIQFINKNKRYIQMKKELTEKQRPILELYQNLTNIKKKLEELGKYVKLDDVKLLYYDEYKKPAEMNAAGEQASLEVVNEMKKSIEEIPKTLMDICKNLLSRRALIVELLESVTKAEIDVSEVSDKIESLKNEGQQLQHSLDAVLTEHQMKITNLVGNWQKLIYDKQSYNTDGKIEDLENKLKEQERLTVESNNLVHELYKKIEERKTLYDKSVADLNGVVQSLKEEIKKLELELDIEKKTTVDFKSRNNTNAQAVKSMRQKITELENDKKTVEGSNTEMQKKIRLLQEQIKHKEATWSQEKEELNKNLKHQENLLQKLTAEKNQFETRFTSIAQEKNFIEESLNDTINKLNIQLGDFKNQLADITAQKNDALEKCDGFKYHIAQMERECKETINKVSYSIEWGRAVGDIRASAAAEDCIQEIAKDLQIRELQDKVNQLEKERIAHPERWGLVKNIQVDTTQKSFPRRLEGLTRFQLILNESENALREKLGNLKSPEVENLCAEIRQLKVRQVALEEQNTKCPAVQLQHMVEKSHLKLKQLIKRSVESEQTMEKYIEVLEKQSEQINAMENLLRYRENMTTVLKTSRNELLQEKESLTRYSHELKVILSEVAKQGRIKERLAIELQEKLVVRGRQLKHLLNVIATLEASLVMAHEERFKLQEKIGAMEKKLQNTKEKCTQISRQQDEKVRISRSAQPDHSCIMPIRPRSMPENQESNQNIPKASKVSFSKEVCSFSERSSEGVKKSRNTLLHLVAQNPATTSSQSQHLDASDLDESFSRHLDCKHRISSKSLITLSLQTVDYIKTRLNFLTSVDMVFQDGDVSSGKQSLADFTKVCDERGSEGVKIGRRSKNLQEYECVDES